MNTNSLFSWKYVFGLSLLVSETFYFTLRIQKMLTEDMGHSYIALNRFHVSDIIISLLVLFCFSFFFINFILKINQKTENKVFFYIIDRSNVVFTGNNCFGMFKFMCNFFTLVWAYATKYNLIFSSLWGCLWNQIVFFSWLSHRLRITISLKHF